MHQTKFDDEYALHFRDLALCYAEKLASRVIRYECQTCIVRKLGELLFEFSCGDAVVFFLRHTVRFQSWGCLRRWQIRSQLGKLRL